VAVRANQFQITTHWDAGSEDLVEYAVSRGWCRSAQNFNFARCYSKTGYPYRSSQTRFERGHDLLDDKVGSITREDLIDVLSDHYEGTNMYRTAHSNSDYRTICSRRTVSSMVAHLKPHTPSEMQVMWYCMSSPCIGVFIPVYANVSAIPTPYLTGDAPEDISGYDDDSAWWAYKKIQLLVDEDYDERHAMVRAGWEELYESFASDIDQLEQELRSLYSAGDKEEARIKMDSFVERKLTEAYEASLQTIEELTSAESIEEEHSEDMPEDGEEKEDKTIVYLGLFAFMSLIVIILWLYVKNIGGSRS